MNSDILKEKNIVDRILNDLSKYGEIPNKGFLSGGAVANTLMGYVWDGEYPINDLDIFIDDTDNMVFRNVTTPLRSNNLIIEGDGYMVTKLSYDHGSNYQIVSVEREGFLNTIFISSVQQKVGYAFILNGFDFNCCQVGIDLENNTICYTDSFENFLNNKQLEVTAIYTPGANDISSGAVTLTLTSAKCPPSTSASTLKPSRSSPLMLSPCLPSVQFSLITL